MIKLIDSYLLSKHKQKLYEDEQVDTEFGDPTDISLSGNVEQDFNTLIELLRKESYPDLVEDLEKIVKDPKLYEIFAEGFGEGELANVKMSATTTSIPVDQLLPSQNEIGLDNSLKFPLTKTSDCSIYFKDPVKIVAPIITYRKTFIIDGHHRWSQVYMMNPKAKIAAINFNYSQQSPFRALRNFQGAIAVANKNIESHAGGVNNVYAMSESQIRKYIEDNISDACIQSLIKLNIVKDKESAIDYILKNTLMLKADNPPIAGAPDRDIMPQTDEKSVNIMMQGSTNI